MINLRLAPRKKRDDEWQTINDSPEQWQAAEEKPKRQSWMEGGKFGLRDGFGLALAGIGDAFAKQAGGDGDMMNTLIKRAYSARDMAKQAQAQAAAKQEERQYDRQDWLEKKQWELENTPEKDDVFTSMLRKAGIDPASEQGQALYRQRANTMASPMFQGWDGQRYGGATPTQPPSFTDDDWESGQPLGGAGSGRRTFRAPRLR